MAEMNDQLQAVAAKIGINAMQRHVFLCVGPKCCTTEDGTAAWELLKQKLKDVGLSSGDNVCQLLIRERSNVVAEKLYGLARGQIESDDALFAVLMIDPSGERNALSNAKLPHRKLRHPERIQPRGDRH